MRDIYGWSEAPDFLGDPAIYDDIDLDGDGGIAEAATAPCGGGQQPVAEMNPANCGVNLGFANAGDVDGDGLHDVIVANSVTGTVCVLAASGSPPLGHMNLTVDALVKGLSVELTAEHVPPGADVDFLYTGKDPLDLNQWPQNPRPLTNGVYIDIPPNVDGGNLVWNSLGSATAQSDGTASLSFTVPSAVPNGKKYWFQAVVSTGGPKKSRTVQRVVIAAPGGCP